VSHSLTQYQGPRDIRMMLLGHAQIRLPQLSLRGIRTHPQRGVEIAAALRAAPEHGAAGARPIRWADAKFGEIERDRQ
jgi:hypothetical protein